MNQDFDIDLGFDHYLKFVGWWPDRELNPQYDGIPDVEKFGARIMHKTSTGTDCNGVVTFAGDVQLKINPEGPTWQVESWEPLTLSPSVLCLRCNDHGFVRESKWVKA